MTTLIQRLTQLSAAEEFLDFFGIPYEQAVLNVSRLHILKRFYQYMRQEQGLDVLDELEMFKRLRTLLARAYGDFTQSTPAQEKVFRVFQNIDGRSVPLDALRMTMRSANQQ